MLVRAENSPSCEHCGGKHFKKIVEKHTDIAVRALILVSVL